MIEHLSFIGRLEDIEEKESPISKLLLGGIKCIKVIISKDNQRFDFYRTEWSYVQEDYLSIIRKLSGKPELNIDKKKINEEIKNLKSNKGNLVRVVFDWKTNNLKDQLQDLATYFCKFPKKYREINSIEYLE